MEIISAALHRIAHKTALSLVHFFDMISDTKGPKKTLISNPDFRGSVPTRLSSVPR